VLTSLDAVLGSLKLYHSMPKEHIRVFLACSGSMGHPSTKGLFDNDFSACQAPFVRTAILRSQYSRRVSFIASQAVPQKTSPQC